jgi:NitT/TauT family transport system permease protein
MSVEVESILAVESVGLLVHGPRIAAQISAPPARREGRDLGSELPVRLKVATFSVLRRCGAIAAFFAVWEIAPRLGLVERSLVPPFSEVATAWFRMLFSGELLVHLAASLVRSVGGFALAAAVAIPLGLAIGWSRVLSESLSPLLELFRNTAALALLPVFTLLLGIGEASKIALVTFACVWPILLNTISGVRNADPLLVKSARTMGVEGLALFRKVILPSSLPSIFVGLRISAAVSVLALVAAEMIGAKAGLGYLVQYAQFSFMVPEMFAGILTIALVGVLLNAIFAGLERRVTRWKPTTDRTI